MIKEQYDFLLQLVRALEDSVEKLESSYNRNDFQNFIRIKAYIEKVEHTISEVLG